MLDSLGQCFILSLLQVVYCVRFCFFVLFSVCLVRYVLFGFVRISLFRWSVRFSVRSLILSTSPFHRTWVCLILAVFSCEDHTNSFPSAVLIHSVYYHHKCRFISVIYGLMIDWHSKHPVTYRAQQAIIATIIRLPWKTFALLTRYRDKVKRNNCWVSKLERCSYRRYKGIYVTRKVWERSRNGPQLPGRALYRYHRYQGSSPRSGLNFSGLLASA